MALKQIRGLGWLGDMTRRDMLAFVPAAGLAGYWYGLAGAVLVVSAAIGVAWLARPSGTSGAGTLPALHPATRLPLRAAAEAALDAALEDTASTGRGTAAFVVGFDDGAALAASAGEAGHAQVLRRTAERLHGALREHDLVAQLDDGRFAVVLAPVRRADLESVLQIAARLQAAVEVPLSLDSSIAYVSAHVGFCLLSRTPARRGAAMLAAAETAADEAARYGPGAIRAYSSEIQAATDSRPDLADEAATALEGGQIVAHFLPQISSDTGEVSGFELVPCWLNTERGYLAGDTLLAIIDGAGLRARLNEVLLYHGFSALRGWAESGLGAATLLLPLAAGDLRDPKLPERLKWDIDRFEIAPGKLRLLVPQAALSGPASEVVGHTLAALARLGVGIDLAGFGLGGAPIAALRAMSVGRLHIDRALVTQLDTDPEQQKVVAAILSMAERLGLDTLAEGVASLGEHAMLAQLGCDHVQGPAIARAMAFEDTLPWLERHRGKLQAAPRMQRRKR